MPLPLLSQPGVLLSKIETTYNVDAVPTLAADALLVSDPQWTVDPSMLERNFSRYSLSQLTHKMGRKLAGMTFGAEFRGSGDVTVAPKIGRLLRASGYAQTQITPGVAQVGAVKADPRGASGPVVTFGTITMGAAVIDEPILYTIEVTTAGASGVAKVKVTPDANALAQGYDTARTNVTITTATPFPLSAAGNSGGFTPAWTGNLVLGQKWRVWVYPVGFLYTPVSTGFESVTNYLYKDGGLLHKLPGGVGTFTMDAEGGQYPTCSFTFTGQYVAPTDSGGLPTSAVYEETQPPVVENAALYIDDFGAVVNKFSFDQSNQISTRSDVSKPDGYNGVRITGRSPKGGIDPEMNLVAQEDFWAKLASAKAMPFRMRFGTDVGNRQWVLAPATQYTGMSYQSRDSFLVLDAGLTFRSGWQGGDDEVAFFFG